MYGIVNEISKPHILNNRGGNYNGNQEYHLSNGKVDVLVIYNPHKTNLTIRMIRIGTHKDLFQGELKWFSYAKRITSIKNLSNTTQKRHSEFFWMSFYFSYK